MLFGTEYKIPATAVTTMSMVINKIVKILSLSRSFTHSLYLSFNFADGLGDVQHSTQTWLPSVQILRFICLRLTKLF